MFMSLARHDISAAGRDRMLAIVLDGLRTAAPTSKPKKRAAVR